MIKNVKIISQGFDDENYALLRLIKNYAFLYLQMKESRLILNKYYINKSLLLFIFIFGLRINKKSPFNLQNQILIFLCNSNSNKKLIKSLEMLSFKNIFLKK